MHEPAFFCRFQRSSHLQRDVDRCRNIEWPKTANPFFQRFTFNQFHRVEELAGFLVNSELIHRCHIRVPQGSGRARFAHEALPRFCAARSKIGVDDF